MVGIADVGHDTVEFQALRDNEVIARGNDYEIVRYILMEAVRFSPVENSHGLQ